MLPTFLISIHALLAESDLSAPHSTQKRSYFYPRSPCGERLMLIVITVSEIYFYPRSPCGERLCADGFRRLIIRFLSTLSLRRATTRSVTATHTIIYFYPRSPCGERPDGLLGMVTFAIISIHALLAESDADHRAAFGQVCIFLSTLSLRRATSGLEREQRREIYFYPRSPCGERRRYIN